MVSTIAIDCVLNHYECTGSDSKGVMRKVPISVILLVTIYNVLISFEIILHLLKGLEKTLF